MEQKDIDRLLICRAAVDKQRAFNAARVEAYTTCKSVTEAKALIESKIGVATTISTDTAVKSTDEIKKILESERTKYTLEMNEILRQQGFETFSDFVTWNDTMNSKAFKESYPVSGFCDYCGESELKEQNCIKEYGRTECTLRVKGGGVDMGAWYAAYKGFKENTHRIVKDRYYGLCPDDHGFYVLLVDIKVPPFDVFWRA